VQLLPNSGLIVPFQSHYAFSVALARHIGDFLEVYTSGSWTLVQTGAASLSFVPDIEFARNVHMQIAPQFITSGKTPGKWVICIRPEVNGQTVLLRAFAFDAVGQKCEQRVDFIESAEQQEASLSMAQQLIKFVPLPMSSDHDGRTERLLKIGKEGREELWLLLGIHFAQAGQFALGRSYWSNVLNTISKNSFHAMMNMGQSFNDEQNWEEADDWLSLAIERCPGENQRYLARYNRGIARKNTGNWESAIEDYRECLALKPDFGMAYVNLGATLLDNGKKEEAEPWFRRCLELRNDSSVALGDAKQLSIENLKKMGKKV
jgi:tetratricopeptide (TPR) repeat protein